MNKPFNRFFFCKHSTRHNHYCVHSFSSILCILLLAFQTNNISAAPSVNDIVTRTEAVAYYQGEDGRAQVSMTITDDQGRKRRRRFTILRYNQQVPNQAVGSSSPQKYYVHLQSPSDVRNTVFMVWKNPGSNEDRWLYLPALDLVKRIAAGDKRTSFLGSDFYYEDISGRSTVEDKHELIEENKDYYVIKNTPVLVQAVDFSYYTMWIHKDSFVTTRVEYVDKKGKKYRIYDVIDVQTFSGYPTIIKSRMKDLRRRSETELVFSRVQYNIGIPDKIFTERYLRNPPTRFMR